MNGKLISLKETTGTKDQRESEEVFMNMYASKNIHSIYRTERVEMLSSCLTTTDGGVVY